MLLCYSIFNDSDRLLGLPTGQHESFFLTVQIYSLYDSTLITDMVLKGTLRLKYFWPIKRYIDWIADDIHMLKMSYIYGQTCWCKCDINNYKKNKPTGNHWNMEMVTKINGKTYTNTAQYFWPSRKTIQAQKLSIWDHASTSDGQNLQ